MIVFSRNGVPVRFTEERWRHIVDHHPEMENQRDKILETIGEPDLIQEGDFGALLAIRFYPKTPLTSKYLVLAYREVTKDDGFVLTAYFTNRPSSRRAVIWKR